MLFDPYFLCNHANTFTISSAFKAIRVAWPIRNMVQMVSVDLSLSVIVSMPSQKLLQITFIWIILMAKLSLAETCNKIQFCLLLLVLKSEQFPITFFNLVSPGIIFSLGGYHGRCFEITAPLNGTCREKKC